MIDPAHTEAALYRVAICAFTYHPNKHLDEPGYTLDEDLTWCLEPLVNLQEAELADMRDTITTLITNPTADRQVFIRRLAALSGDSTNGLHGAAEPAGDREPGQ